MEINYWNSEDWAKTDEELILRDRNSNLLIKEIIKQYDGKIPPINSIEIETVNRCNNDCSFCPVSKKNDIRKTTLMDEELFYSIIDQLAEMKYEGYLSLFSNNEPLIDKRFTKFLDYASSKLPNSKHCLFTNGILLTQDIYDFLVQRLDYLVIDNYSDEFKLLENVDAIMQQEQGKTNKCRVRVDVRKKNQVLSNRGGLAPNKASELRFVSGCILPFLQIVIRPDGKVSRCCQDAYGNTTMGDLNKESLKDIWQGANYTEFRRTLIEKGRAGVSACQKCDLFGLNNYFPEKWMHFWYSFVIDKCYEEIENGKEILVVGDKRCTSYIANELKIHGITYKCVDAYSETEHAFNVFATYEDALKYKVDINDLCKRFVIFENPEIFKLQKDEKEDSRSLYGRIIDACVNNNLILFGAGYVAACLCEKYSLKVKYFVDNNANRYGDEYLGSVINPVSSIVEDSQTVILVASVKSSEMIEQLKDLNISDDRIIDGNLLL